MILKHFSMYESLNTYICFIKTYIMTELIYEKLETEEAKRLFRFIERYHKYVMSYMDNEENVFIKSKHNLDKLSDEEKENILTDFKELKPGEFSKVGDYMRSSSSRSKISLIFERKYTGIFTREIFKEIKDHIKTYT